MTAKDENEKQAIEEQIASYKVRRHPAHLIRRAHQRGSQLFSAAVLLHDLTASQFAALAVLFRSGPMPQSRLGRLVSMDPSTTRVVLRKSLADKLIEKTKLPTDLRTSVIALTEAGRLCVKAHIPISIRAGEELLAPLSYGERVLLLELLGKIAPEEDLS